MTNRGLGVLAIMTVFLGIASCGREQPAANGQSKATAPQWEFKVAYIEAQATVEGNPIDPKSWEKTASKLSEFYTSLGADGWEYVGTHGSVFVVFKRPKR